VDTIRIERRNSSTVRLPRVEPGEAIVFTRYGEERSVAMNPVDFHRLLALESAFDALTDEDGPAVDDLVRKAHELEDTPGEPLEDAEAIEAFLGR